MQYNHPRKRTVRVTDARALTLAVVVLAAVAAAGPAHAATETITVSRNVGSSVYYVSSPPSAASGCNLDDRLHPVTVPALKTFKKVLDPKPPLVGFIRFSCKAEIYASEPGSCSVFKLARCECTVGCL